ncbi:hypothetical protein EOW52_23655 [Salmonella enterica]|nr:hypothetical protein CHD70_27795 [Salmonella enterica]EAS5879275.1 hypothetical protein [Salmonella enterica]EAU6767329.1 hypothetical protein [Salmonella enterica]EAU9939495.1 hypothetical protein [Salmonella enterica]
MQFIKNSIAINYKSHNNQQKTADLIYHNHTLRAQLRLEVIHAGNFGGSGVETQNQAITQIYVQAPEIL